jgi:FlaG/FlaF family flagellin (archaellin)
MGKINGKRFRVIGVVLMMMLVVMITSVIAAFVFDAVTGEKQSPCAELVVEGAVEKEKGNHNITIVHYGGDRINLGSSLNNIEIKYNGQVCNRTNITPSNPADAFFDLGEKMEVNVTYGATGDPTRNFTAGDSICIVYKPADCILQRVMVV